MPGSLPLEVQVIGTAVVPTHGIPQGHGKEGGEGVAVPTAEGSSSGELGSPPTKLLQPPGLSGRHRWTCPALPTLSICLCSETSVALQLQSPALSPAVLQAPPVPFLNILKGRGPCGSFLKPRGPDLAGAHPNHPWTQKKREACLGERAEPPGTLAHVARMGLSWGRNCRGLSTPKQGELSVYSSPGLLPSPWETEACGA